MGRGVGLISNLLWISAPRSSFDPVSRVVAFTTAHLRKLLRCRAPDLLYYVYLHRMPEINAFISRHFQAAAASSFMIAKLTILILAGLSWRLVERPALRLKIAPASAKVVFGGTAR